MQAPRGVRPARQGGVEPGEHGLVLGALESLQTHGVVRREFLFHGVGRLARLALLLGGEAGELGHNLGQAALAAQIGHAQFLKGLERGRLAEGVLGFPGQGGQFLNQGLA